MGGGPAEVPVIYEERSSQAEQRLDGQERDLPTRRDRRPSSELPKLLPRLTDSQVQEIGELSHTARLHPDNSPRKSPGNCACHSPMLYLASRSTSWVPLMRVSGLPLANSCALGPNSAVVTKIPLVAPSCSIVP